MIETHMRNMVQPLFDRFGKLLLVCRLTPNIITFFAFVTGCLGGYFIATNQTELAIAMIVTTGLCDIMDGTLARLSNNIQKVGAYMDLIVDRMVESAIILGFAWWQPAHSLAYLTFLTAVMFHFSTFIVAGALFTNTGKKSMHYDKSIVERSEAFVVFGLMLYYPSFIFEILMAFNAIIFLSGIARFFRVLSHAQGTKRGRKPRKAA